MRISDWSSDVCSSDLKVAIVSPKVQTTRTRLMSIAIEGETQLMMVDTPGIFAQRRRLDRAMVAAAWEGAQDDDVIALVVDAKTGLRDQVEAILDSLAKSSDAKSAKERRGGKESV